MLIKCPRCQARATLPDSKQGAKVKCGECGRIFVALPPGTKGSFSGSNTGLWIGVAVALAAALGFLILNSQDDPPAQAKTTAPVRAGSDQPYVDELSWNGPIVKAARAMHDAVQRKDLERVKKMLAAERIWARENAAEDGTLPDPAGYFALGRLDQIALVDRVALDLVEGEGHELVGAWDPYDGVVVEALDETAVARLSVTPFGDSGSAEKRTVQWKLARTGAGSWKAWSWERWVSPEEAARIARANRAKNVEKVTLSDGSVVYERKPEPLAHLSTTPPELAAEIDRLYARMIDLDLTTEARDARTALEGIGRPAIPILLTGLYETPLDSEENAIKANIIDQTLRTITGQDFGYKPQVMQGSGAGTTEERRQSAIKQWFAWWYLNEKRFTGKAEETDGLEGLIDLTQKEKDWLERNQD